LAAALEVLITWLKDASLQANWLQVDHAHGLPSPCYEPWFHRRSPCTWQLPSTPSW
jgi:hypothetical protein